MNNANTSENTQAAESRLRDTDMAEEMMEYSKNNILEQAGISMLMQANQNFRGILGSLQWWWEALERWDNWIYDGTLMAICLS